MKYALIGCGRIAINHLRAAALHEMEIVGLCDVCPENITILRNKLGRSLPNAREFIHYQDMIQQVQPDLVSIATESGLHAEIALYCIRRGIHTIIEKPMAMCMEDARRIVDEAAHYQVKVSVCHQNRFNIAVLKTKKAIDRQRFGKISHGTIHVRWNRNEDYYKQAPWRGKWTQDGGALMNQCIHGIDLLRWLLGSEIDEVYGVTRQQFHHYIEAEDVGLAVVKFKNGAIATIEGTTNIYPKNLEETLYLFGEKGTVKIGGVSANNIDVWQFDSVDEQDEETRQVAEETPNVYGNGHIALFADMIDAINNDRNPYVDAQAGLDALELVLAIYKSQKENKVVKLPLEDFASGDMAGEFGK